MEELAGTLNKMCNHQLAINVVTNIESLLGTNLGAEIMNKMGINSSFCLFEMHAKFKRARETV